jgi:hypothetical protein
MKDDIKFPKVEGIILTAVKEVIDGEDVWDVYIVNQNKNTLTDILVASKGYGLKDGKPVKTSVLRHHFDELTGNGFQKIEPIQKELFGLSNEYWVSFYVNGSIYDKKYVFLAESIKEENTITIPVINKQGVMLK